MADRKTFLVVEDDTDLRDMIVMAGRKQSYGIMEAANGLEARSQILETGPPDLVILDINMPGMDGLTFCRWLREDHPLVPVIFLSARSEEYDKIIALEIGGDDYLTKPFSMKELFTRVKVCLRRAQFYGSNSKGEDPGEQILSSGSLVLNEGSWTSFYKGAALELTISEFRILQKLVSSPGIVFSRDQLASAAFPEDLYHSSRGVDIHIHRVRQKISAIDRNFDSLETVYQVGYKWRS